METLKKLISKFFKAMTASSFAEHGDVEQAVEILNSCECEEEKCPRNTQE